jgi:hypothetical protein
LPTRTPGFGIVSGSVTLTAGVTRDAVQVAVQERVVGLEASTPPLRRGGREKTPAMRAMSYVLGAEGSDDGDVGGGSYWWWQSTEAKSARWVLSPLTGRPTRQMIRIILSFSAQFAHFSAHSARGGRAHSWPACVLGGGGGGTGRPPRLSPGPRGSGRAAGAWGPTRGGRRQGPPRTRSVAHKRSRFAMRSCPVGVRRGRGRGPSR